MTPASFRSLRLALISTVPSGMQYCFYLLPWLGVGVSEASIWFSPTTLILTPQIKEQYRVQPTTMYVYSNYTFRDWGNGYWMSVWSQWIHCESNMGQVSNDHLVSICHHSSKGIMMILQVTAINFNLNSVSNSPPMSMNYSFLIVWLLDETVIDPFGEGL